VITVFASASTHTGRLELIPASLEVLTSDRGDRAGLGRLLNAAIPAGWPPPLLEDAVLAEFIRILEEGSDPAFCCWYWVLTGTGNKKRTLIGSGGTASLPESPDTVLVGYSVLEEFQGRGYATEAVRHMIPVIFSRPGIRKILATTNPELIPSVRVLEKNGFVPTGNPGSGSGMEEGTLEFILIKPDD
jgi:RimJ/RimL family protein N-acetyltransferase